MNYEDEPCGADGYSFSNGFPLAGQEVEVRTVWSNGEWKRTIFQKLFDKYNYRTDWFANYARPNAERGFLPVVLEWRPLNVNNVAGNQMTGHAETRKTLENIIEKLGDIRHGPWKYSQLNDNLSTNKFQIFETFGGDLPIAVVQSNEMIANHITNCNPNIMRSIQYLIDDQDKKIAELENVLLDITVLVDDDEVANAYSPDKNLAAKFPFLIPMHEAEIAESGRHCWANSQS